MDIIPDHEDWLLNTSVHLRHQILDIFYFGMIQEVLTL